MNLILFLLTVGGISLFCIVIITFDHVIGAVRESLNSKPDPTIHYTWKK